MIFKFPFLNSKNNKIQIVEYGLVETKIKLLPLSHFFLVLFTVD